MERQLRARFASSDFELRCERFRIDADTLVVLAVVWFALGDQDGEMDTELLVVLAVLLLLGI